MLLRSIRQVLRGGLANEMWWIRNDLLNTVVHLSRKGIVRMGIRARSSRRQRGWRWETFWIRSSSLEVMGMNHVELVLRDLTEFGLSRKSTRLSNVRFISSSSSVHSSHLFETPLTQLAPTLDHSWTRNRVVHHRFRSYRARTCTSTH